ncbi:hypothetical protein AK812_SmicGene40574, partial [Symbiodinium microadriaticum]
MSLDALEVFFGGRVAERRIQAELQVEAWPESRDLEKAHFRAMQAIQAQLGSLRDMELGGRCFYADHLMDMEEEACHHRDLTDMICGYLRVELDVNRESAPKAEELPVVVPTTDKLLELLDAEIELENLVRVMLSLGRSSDPEKQMISDLSKCRAILGVLAREMGVKLTAHFAEEVRARKLRELKIMESQAQGLRLEVEDLERLTGASQLQRREHQVDQRSQSAAYRTVTSQLHKNPSEDPVLDPE